MSLAFVGIENPLGLVGLKQRGVIKKADELIHTGSEPVTKRGLHDHMLRQQNSSPDPFSKKIGHLVETKKTVEYETRRQTLQDQKADWAKGKNYLADLTDDARGNQETIRKILAKASNPDLRVASCSSLTSLLKYMKNHSVANAGAKFDTLVLYGHGAKGSMNIGLGRLNLGPESPLQTTLGMRRAKDEGLKPPRIREVGVDNKDIWGSSFAGIKDCVEESDETGYFHVFLMACEVGEAGRGHDVKGLPKVVAETLKSCLGISICAAAPNGSIDADDLMYLLGHLKTARQDTAIAEDFTINDTRFTAEKR